MSKTITISETKGIKNLIFDFPENNGVYLIVGPNGTGKTTLLVCMDRICNPYAFARGLSHPKNISGYDEYRNSTIQYDVNNSCIRFRKKHARWAASPRKGNADLLSEFGYNNSIFIKADSKRIDATQEEIQRGTTTSANREIIQILNEIFETDKYNNLKKLKVSHGRGKLSSYFNIIKDGACYYTEKRFSTGEIAILRLIENIEVAENGALILLDEAEMALHPRVQVNLLAYLKKKSLEKNLTIFISTHSPTMIKSTKPSNILLLDYDSFGNVNICTPCYPARALGGIDYEESKIFDYIFFVEDDMARIFLKRIINRYILLVQKHSTASTSIIPVGGFFETARMAVMTNQQLFGHSKVFALVDADAFDELDTKPKFKELYENNHSLIHSLTITPEVKFIDVLTSRNMDFRNLFRNKMHCEINSIIYSDEYIACNSEKARKLAKDRFSVFVNHCCNSTGDNESTITNELIYMIADTISDGEIQRILGPIFNSRD